MSDGSRLVAIAATILGFSAVVLAALGSHVVNMHDQPYLRQIWQTASIIHLVHSAALLGLAALWSSMKLPSLSWASWALFLGTVIFCGSIYLRVITGGSLTGAAPIGGVLLMLGWLLALLSFVRRQ